MIPRTIEIGGKRYLWRDIVELRPAQLAAARQAGQPALFEVIEDCRPPSQRTAAGRYIEPILFETWRNGLSGPFWDTGAALFCGLKIPVSRHLEVQFT
jgi:hypothetical protein